MLEHKQQKQRAFFSSSLGSWLDWLVASDVVLVEVSLDFRFVSGLWICFVINPDLQISETMFSETHRVWTLISDPIKQL